MPISARRAADFYTREAKKRGYPARSIFKLQEVNDKYKLLKPGQRVLDFGCVPGSWTMYAAEQVGSKGMVMGIDINSTTQIFPRHVRILQQDIFTWKPNPSLFGSFDVLLSDMAPNTTGVKDYDATSSFELCQHTLSLAHKLVKPNGTLLMKIFAGREFEGFLRDFRSHFNLSKCVKPKSSRSESVESFLLGMGFIKGKGGEGGKEEKEKEKMNRLVGKRGVTGAAGAGVGAGGGEADESVAKPGSHVK